MRDFFKKKTQNSIIIHLFFCIFLDKNCSGAKNASQNGGAPKKFNQKWFRNEKFSKKMVAAKVTMRGSKMRQMPKFSRYFCNPEMNC
jgi:hypothetical protein